MLFTSLAFAVFLPLVFLLYWFVFNRNLKLQNLYLFVVSMIFYGWWDWRFLILLLASSMVDYYFSLRIKHTEDERKRKLFLGITLLSNLGVLGLFKYFNFFSESFISVLQAVGFQADFVTINVLLPVGISFYTFQTMSYTIDVYRRKLEPTHDVVAYFAFVSFFPQLVAGPIERAKSLLPQFYVKRTFNRANAEDGLRQMLWGFFKKVVVADNCSLYVDHIFGNYETMEPAYLLLGALYFSFQIYGDFSGYTDIALGSARLFGFNLNRNFAYPYFSRDIAEFWRRWHISLSTWFRDYVYIPLGGSQVSPSRRLFNVFAVFLLSGFWHGANWTFVFWGFLNGFAFLLLMLFADHKKNSEIVAQDSMLPSIREIFGIVATFSFTLIAWVFFRSESLASAFDYISRMISLEVFSIPPRMKSVIPLILIMLIVEWVQRKKQHGLQIEQVPQVLRWNFYMVLVGFIAYFSSEQDIAFIYFQF